MKPNPHLSIVKALELHSRGKGRSLPSVECSLMSSLTEFHTTLYGLIQQGMQEPSTHTHTHIWKLSDGGLLSPWSRSISHPYEGTPNFEYVETSLPFFCKETFLGAGVQHDVPLYSPPVFRRHCL